MGIRLDWEVDADKQTIRGVGEDPNWKRARRGVYLRIFITVLIAVGIIAAIIYAVLSRLDAVDGEVEQILRDTVDAEVTALRIGDWPTFAQIQRSASPQWLQQQQVVFDDYQELLRRADDVQLSGTILDLSIDDPRARVKVQEIVDGVPYARLWFYFRYENDLNGDGIADNWQWHHVPPDTEFWGESAEIEGEFVTVEYRSVDEQMAEQMATRLDEWIGMACTALICSEVQPLKVSILSDNVNGVEWSPADPWRLLVLSPYTSVARADMPFAPELQVDVANMLAERLVLASAGSDSLDVGTDAYFLQWEAIVPWLVGRFTQVNTGAYLIESLATNYGQQVIGQLLQALPSDPNISVLTQVIGVPLDAANLDWRDFFTYRLSWEQRLIAAGNSDAVAALYDTSDDVAVQAAFRRVNEGIVHDSIVVALVQTVGNAADGRAQRLVTARVGEGESAADQQILFRLQNNVWKRAE